MKILYTRLYPKNISGLNVHIQATIYNPSFANVTDMGIVRFDMAYGSSSTFDIDSGSLSLGHLFTDGPLSVVPGKNKTFFYKLLIFLFSLLSSFRYISL